MRLLACSDVHGSHKALNELEKKAKNADIIIVCGDFTIFGNEMRRILNRFNSFGKIVLLITGNHEAIGNIQRELRQFSNIVFLNNKLFRQDGVLFYGYDTNGFGFIDKRFERDAEKFVKEINKLRLKNKLQIKTVLISHAPPYKTKADRVMDEHCGNKSVRHFILKHKIDYCFGGHIHEGARTVTRLKKTVVVNPGPFGMVFEV